MPINAILSFTLNSQLNFFVCVSLRNASNENEKQKNCYEEWKFSVSSASGRQFRYIIFGSSLGYWQHRSNANSSSLRHNIHFRLGINHLANRPKSKNRKKKKKLPSMRTNIICGLKTLKTSILFVVCRFTDVHTLGAHSHGIPHRHHRRHHTQPYGMAWIW